MDIIYLSGDNMKHKNSLFFTLKLIITILIAIIFSYSYLHNNFKEETINCPNCKETEKYLNSTKNLDLSEIKKEIEILNNPPSPPEPIPTPAPKEPPQNPPTSPSTSESAKDIFQRNKAMIIGNSFVEGMTAYNVLYPSNTIWSRGIRINNMSNQLEQAINYQPNMLILSYGTNDILIWNSNVDAFINAYRTSITQIKTSLPNTIIKICSILPVNDKALSEKPAFQYIDLYNQELEKLCQELGIQFLNSSDLLNLENNPYEFDGIHPKGFFYPKWANDIINKTKMR